MKKFFLLLGVLAVLGASTGCNKNTIPLSPAVQNNLGGNTAAVASPTPQFLAQWNKGVGQVGLSNPTGIGVDASGNVYVVDTDYDDVTKFDASGNPLAKFGQTGNGQGQFSAPFGLAVDANGNLYVADAGNKRVQKLDANGGFLAQVTAPTLNGVAFSYPQAVGVSPSGDLLVDDLTNAVWDFNGTTLATQYGKTGATQGQFNYPLGMAADASGNLYVVNYQANNVIKFNPAAGTVVVLGQSGNGPGQFLNPTDVKLDAQGNLYVVDSGNNRVQKLDAKGNFLLQWGATGTASQKLSNPMAIALGPNGSIYVTDNGNSRVVKYASK